jgi:hypothetical protein
MILGRDPRDPTAVQLTWDSQEIELVSKVETKIDQLDPPLVDLMMPDPPPA